MSIDAMSWAEAHFSGADLGDARRTKRLVEVMARMAEAPDESLPARMGTVAGAKAAYRLFATGAVTHASVMDPHRRLCLAEAAHHPVVLMIHDDTLLDVSGHQSLSGTGRIGNGHGTGLIAHSCLAVLPSGEVLGLVHQAICTPPAGLSITHIFSRSINGLPTLLEVVSFCAEPFEGFHFERSYRTQTEPTA